MFFCFFYVPAKSPRADLRDATLSNIDCSVVENVRKLPSTAAGVPHAHGCSSTDPSPPITGTSTSTSRNNKSDGASLVTICAHLLLLLPLCSMQSETLVRGTLPTIGAAPVCHEEYVYGCVLCIGASSSSVGPIVKPLFNDFLSKDLMFLRNLATIEHASMSMLLLCVRNLRFLQLLFAYFHS